MLYPNKINKEYHNNVSHSNRGMDLEYLINEANTHYSNTEKALIYKKPTPVQINKVDYSKKFPEVKGKLNQKSTLDYVGVYKGKYIDFDAKKTLNKTSFPLSNIHEHQINHIKKVLQHDGISFLIIEINNEVYILKGETLLDFIKDNDRKSIPYEYIKEQAYKINYGYNPILNYLDVLDKIYY